MILNAILANQFIDLLNTSKYDKCYSCDFQTTNCHKCIICMYLELIWVRVWGGGWGNNIRYTSTCYPVFEGVRGWGNNILYELPRLCHLFSWGLGSGFGWELELGSGWGKNIRYIPLHVIPQEKSFLLVRGLSHQHPFFLWSWPRPNIAVAWPSDLIPYFNVEHWILKNTCEQSAYVKNVLKCLDCIGKSKKTKVSILKQLVDWSPDFGEMTWWPRILCTCKWNEHVKPNHGEFDTKNCPRIVLSKLTTSISNHGQRRPWRLKQWQILVFYLFTSLCAHDFPCVSWWFPASPEKRICFSFWLLGGW